MKITTLKYFFIALSSLAFICLFSACEQQKEYQEIKKELQEGLDQIHQDLTQEYEEKEQQVRELAEEEKRKLFSIEYKVFDLELGADAETHEKQLNELGLDRWECFFIDKSEEHYRAFCRRKPRSYLRHIAKIPAFIPLKFE